MSRSSARFNARARTAAVAAAVLMVLGSTAGASSLPGDGGYDPLPATSVWGPDDEAGNTNTQTPAKALEAAALIRSGEKYLLGHVYERTMPAFPGNTWNMEAKPPLTILQHVANQEYFHGELAQNGTQFDGLGHYGIHPHLAEPHETLYYNRWSGSEVNGPLGLERLGVEKLKPFFTRAILLDVARHANGGATLAPGTEVTMDMVRTTLAAQRMTESDIRKGDVVLFRTGWEEFWDDGTLAYYAGAPGVPGATPGIGLEVAIWLGSKQVACVGADNWGIEVVPNPAPQPGILFPVHNELIVRQGIPLQESMRLSELATDSAARFARGDEEAYTFAYVFVPLPLQGASGSPGIPMAIR